MNEQRFLIHRYCTANWPQVRGEVPFLATGPNFFGWAIKGSLAKYGEHRFVPSFVADIQAVFQENTDLARMCVAELLLREGIVQALWVDHSRSDEKWILSVQQLADEIPANWTIEEAVVEYLSGLSDASHFRQYVAEDQIELVPLVPTG